MALTVPWRKGARWNASKLLTDPYAKAVTGALQMAPAIFGHIGSDDLTANELDSAAYVPHSVVVDDSYDWEGDRPPAIAFNDTVIAYGRGGREIFRTTVEEPLHVRSNAHANSI